MFILKQFKKLVLPINSSAKLVHASIKFINVIPLMTVEISRMKLTAKKTQIHAVQTNSLVLAKSLYVFQNQHVVMVQRNVLMKKMKLVVGNATLTNSNVIIANVYRNHGYAIKQMTVETILMSRNSFVQPHKIKHQFIIYSMNHVMKDSGRIRQICQYYVLSLLNLF